MIITLLGLAVKVSKENNAITNDDEIALNKAKQELENYDYYEIESIGKNTTVIANAGSLEITITLTIKLGKHSAKKRLQGNDIIFIGKFV